MIFLFKEWSQSRILPNTGKILSTKKSADQKNGKFIVRDNSHNFQIYCRGDINFEHRFCKKMKVGPNGHQCEGLPWQKKRKHMETIFSHKRCFTAVKISENISLKNTYCVAS
jgi:hypothetical protein